FADVYDAFNEDADYLALHSALKKRLDAFNIRDGILIDLGCGTGDLTLLLAQDGYDMIGVDLSDEMLSILREKAEEKGVHNLLLLCQDLTELDLYGTVRAAVSTFDTLNHIGPFSQFSKALKRAALFVEPGGIVLFDMNTPFKHKQVLGNQVFELEAEDVFCTWSNHLDEKNHLTDIQIEIIDKETATREVELFQEYYYTMPEIEMACQQAGLQIIEVCDGENFGALRPDSERYLITALKKEI
ncbi:class I SAM-dependent methyltransferase, partial [uncultured Ruthenibacterium sp.]|uniref:class I SAM-dependent DNA methyltransferase n=1 Tax=uncultured Ruthenibacterium sp. TaxID=1905347 RepID=UPI00349E6020